MDHIKKRKWYCDKSIKYLDQLTLRKKLTLYQTVFARGSEKKFAQFRSERICKNSYVLKYK